MVEPVETQTPRRANVVTNAIVEGARVEHNPFLIPPPPPGTPEVRRVEAVQDAAEPVELIDMPPGVSLPAALVDSGTHRSPTPRERVEISRDEIVFVPMAPGVPPVPASDDTVVRPVAAAPAPSAAPPTTTPASTPTQPWRLIADLDGSEIVVQAAVYLGRDPQRDAIRPDADIRSISDPAKTVSKTHALLEADVDGLWVRDLDSTNGVYLTAPGAAEVPVEPGQRVSIAAGSRLDLGDFVLRAER